MEKYIKILIVSIIVITYNSCSSSTRYPSTKNEIIKIHNDDYKLRNELRRDRNRNRSKLRHQNRNKIQNERNKDSRIITLFDNGE